ncbi:MAG TPA: hypothetical protein VJS92_14060 [Candidatus Polarisedimenticolaceae bacterium]|nr:hypothetical protein [Candidatus Polarisedimenticolaceae bacterium]
MLHHAQEPTASEPPRVESIEHMEEEVRELEGIGRPRWGLLLSGLVVAGLVIGSYIVWMRPAGRASLPPPAVDSGTPIEVAQPRPGRFAELPTHYAWESVAGRSDYLFTLTMEGASMPLVQRVVKTPSLDLTPEEAGSLPAGKRYVWRVTARRDGQSLGSGQGRFELR